MERKLLSLREVRGIVFGNFGEVSEDVHQLVAVMADSRVKVAVPVSAKKDLRREDFQRSTVISTIRRMLSVAGVRAQAFSLLGRLDTLGPGGKPAAGRRRQAANEERLLSLEQRAFMVSRRQSRNIYRTGFSKLT